MSHLWSHGLTVLLHRVCPGLSQGPRVQVSVGWLFVTTSSSFRHCFVSLYFIVVYHVSPSVTIICHYLCYVIDVYHVHRCFPFVLSAIVMCQCCGVIVCSCCLSKVMSVIAYLIYLSSRVRSLCGSLVTPVHVLVN